MNRLPSDAEVKAVLQLDAQRRYVHLLKQIADNEIVWSLRDDRGWNLCGDQNGNVQIPVWPHAAYANLCANGVWHGSTSAEIELEAWISRWLVGIARDNHRIAAFPTPNSKGIVVTAEKFEQDLRQELQKYQ